MRKKVMLSAAFTAAPITAPVVPLMPLARSTATTGQPAAFIASTAASAAPVIGRSSPAPNKRVDDDRGARHVERRRHLAVPAGGRPGGIALEPVARTDEADPHAHAGGGEMARGDEPVAAVIAGAGDDRHPAPRRMAPQHRAGDGGAGLLHERGSRRSGRDGPPVRLRHLVVGEKLDHCILCEGSAGDARQASHAPRLNRIHSQCRRPRLRALCAVWHNFNHTLPGWAAKRPAIGG